MYKKTITYTDYDGVERTEDYYFNLSQAEIVEKQMTTEGGYSKMLERIVKANDTPVLFKEFKDLMMLAYGEKSADGKRFVKVHRDGHRLADDFAQTEAFSIFLVELVSNSKVAAEFVRAIIPGKIDVKILDNAPTN